MFNAFCKNSMDIGAGIFVHSAIPQLPGKRVNPRVDSSSRDDIVTHQEGMDSGIHLSVFFLHFLSFLNTTLPLNIQHFTKVILWLPSWCPKFLVSCRTLVSRISSQGLCAGETFGRKQVWSQALFTLFL